MRNRAGLGHACASNALQRRQSSLSETNCVQSGWARGGASVPAAIAATIRRLSYREKGTVPLTLGAPTASCSPSEAAQLLPLRGEQQLLRATGRQVCLWLPWGRCWWSSALDSALGRFRLAAGPKQRVPGSVSQTRLASTTALSCVRLWIAERRRLRPIFPRNTWHPPGSKPAEELMQSSNVCQAAIT